MKPVQGLLAASLALFSACSPGAARRTVAAGPWECGYWYWRQPDGVGAASFAMQPDRLYVQVGTLSPAGLRGSRWPTGLPKAGRILVLWRSD